MSFAGKLFWYYDKLNSNLAFYTVLPGNFHKIEYGIYVKAPRLLFVVKDMEYLEGWISDQGQTSVDLYIKVMTNFATRPEELRLLYIPRDRFVQDLYNGSLKEAVPEDV